LTAGSALIFSTPSPNLNRRLIVWDVKIRPIFRVCWCVHTGWRACSAYQCIGHNSNVVESCYIVKWLRSGPKAYIWC
jgi:hypothetical protein